MSETRPSRAEMWELPMDVRWAVKAARASPVRWGSGGGGGGGSCSTWVAEEVDVVMVSSSPLLEASLMGKVWFASSSRYPTAACRSAEPHNFNASSLLYGFHHPWSIVRIGPSESIMFPGYEVLAGTNPPRLIATARQPASLPQPADLNAQLTGRDCFVP